MIVADEIQIADTDLDGLERGKYRDKRTEEENKNGGDAHQPERGLLPPRTRAGHSDSSPAD
jgi:hypothetical protein